jgi:hypothetical protein
MCTSGKTAAASHSRIQHSCCTLVLRYGLVPSQDTSGTHHGGVGAHETNASRSLAKKSEKYMRHCVYCATWLALDKGACWPNAMLA